MGVFKTLSANIGVFFLAFIQSQMSQKIKGPDGAGTQSKGVSKHTSDLNIPHNKNKLPWKDEVLIDCRITTATFRTAES